MIPIFQFMQLLFLFTYAFKFIGVDWNPSCMILGTYVMNTRTRSTSRCSANRFGKSRVVSSCYPRELQGLNDFTTCCNYKVDMRGYGTMLKVEVPSE
jgi:hypothetical protein